MTPAQAAADQDIPELKRDAFGKGVKSEIREGEQIMANTFPEFTTEVLQDFADAWNRHDIDALMSFMTDDCVFESSAGPDICGTRYAGREAVRAGFAEVWVMFPDAHWGNACHFVQGDCGVSEWTFTGTRADGARVEFMAVTCSLFETARLL